MSKRRDNKSMKPVGPKAAAKQADTAFPVEQEDLDEQQQVRNAAAVGTEVVEPSSPPAAPPRPAAPAPALKPLTTLEALWPGNVPPKVESKPFAGAGPQVQTAPATQTPESPKGLAVTAQVSKPSVRKSVDVRFRLVKPDAKGVFLCGEFNGWSISATPMDRHDDGYWEATVSLSPGKYQYKFIVDGEWLTDPAARQNVPNNCGSSNSVVDVRA
jgi:hypothetical protein